jgi:hypothetical protein
MSQDNQVRRLIYFLFDWWIEIMKFQSINVIIVITLQSCLLTNVSVSEEEEFTVSMKINRTTVEEPLIFLGLFKGSLSL